MNSVPNNDYTVPDDTNHPSLPFTPHRSEPQNREAQTYVNDLFSNDLLEFGDFNVNTGVAPTPQVPPHGTLPRQVNHLVRRRRLANIRGRGHIRPGAIPRVSPSRTVGFNAPPQANILAPQLTIGPLDGAYTLNTHPSASLSAGPSAMFDGGVPRCHVGPGVLLQQVSPQSNGFPQSHAAVAPQLTIGTFDPITHPSTSRPSGSSSATFNNMTSGLLPMMAPASLAPALKSSSSLNWISPTPKPVVRPWASAASMGPAAFATAASTASVRAEPRQVPVSRCTCCKRVHPFVRVDDTIEWVRPDVMKMVLYFNWSQNAEAEAHESWEPRGV